MVMEFLPKNAADGSMPMNDKHQRIKFLTDIVIYASGDHPSFLLASKDELGWLHSDWSKGYLCVSDSESQPFYCEENEFVYVENV